MASTMSFSEPWPSSLQPAFARRVHSRIEHAPASSTRAFWWGACGVAAAILLGIGIGALRPQLGELRPAGVPPASFRCRCSGAAGGCGQCAGGSRRRTRGTRKPQAGRPHGFTAGKCAPRPARAGSRSSDGVTTVAEVLVPPDQQRAIVHLIRLVRNGTLDGSQSSGSAASRRLSSRRPSSSFPR